MSTRDLVDALIAGDSLAIETAFNATMADKVSASLDNYRVQVAQNMFNTPEETEEESESSEAESEE
jgi:hypothetical protein